MASAMERIQMHFPRARKTKESWNNMAQEHHAGKNIKIQKGSKKDFFKQLSLVGIPTWSRAH
jgi:hypothetical protein